MGVVMALYHLFQFRDGELIGKVTRHCASDLAALHAAEKLSQDQAIEVYEATRLVARAKQGKKPLSVADQHIG